MGLPVNVLNIHSAWEKNCVGRERIKEKKVIIDNAKAFSNELPLFTQKTNLAKREIQYTLASPTVLKGLPDQTSGPKKLVEVNPYTTDLVICRLNGFQVQQALSWHQHQI